MVPLISADWEVVSSGGLVSGACSSPMNAPLDGAMGSFIRSVGGRGNVLWLWRCVEKVDVLLYVRTYVRYEKVHHRSRLQIVHANAEAMLLWMRTPRVRRRAGRFGVDGESIICNQSRSHSSTSVSWLHSLLPCLEKVEALTKMFLLLDE